MSDQDKRMDANDIARILDTASLWSIVMGEDLAGIEATLKKSLGRRITARYELKFSEDVLRQQVARSAGTRDDEQMAIAVAAAMPWHKDFPRSSWRRRAALYANAWFARINRQFTPQQAFNVVRDDLSKNNLAADGVATQAGSLRFELEMNPKVLNDYTRWLSGMSLLAIGRRLSDLAAANGVLDQVGRALAVTQIGDDGKPQKIINIGGKA